jgi:hypothetical protein
MSTPGDYLKALIVLASKPSGTNLPEIMRKLGGGREYASTKLTCAVKIKRLCRADGRRSPSITVLHQYFAWEKHRDLWLQIPEGKRPGIVIKTHHGKNHRRQLELRQSPLQNLNWARAPMIGDVTKPLPKPVKGTQYGISRGYDSRIQMSPEAEKAFIGPFGSLHIGEYLAD